MKGLLRGTVAVGLLAGGVLGFGCSPEKGPRTDTSKSPIQTKYQTPETPEAQPAGEGPISRPSTEGDVNGNAKASRGGASPYEFPATEGLGRALNQDNQAPPVQEGLGGSGQETGTTSPQQDSQKSMQQSPTPPRGE